MDSGFTSQVAQSDFLSLLTIQLQNQDPLEPVKQEDFIGQLTQFSILEGIEGMQGSFEDMLRLQEVTQGMDLVGREIEYLDVATNELKSGEVTEFFVDSGQINVMVNGQALTVDLISGVKN